MPDLYPFLRPVLRKLEPEAARNLTISALEAGLGGLLATKASREPDPPILAQQLWNLEFPNPIGLAAGFDKDARVVGRMWRFGFGFLETGTVTPLPQQGNPKPRLFRLYEDEAVINRMGFNSDGIDLILKRLQKPRRQVGIVGINIGKNRDSADAVYDYEYCLRSSISSAQYFVINISSPNTAGLRDLQRREPLHNLMQRLFATMKEVKSTAPLLLKIAPDLNYKEQEEIVQVSLELGINGIIISNTTITRPADLRSPHSGETGGLSGRPLFRPSTELLRHFYRMTGGRIPLIGVGGIASANDAYEKIRAGASLVQLYTALVFRGPALVTQIKQGLAALLHRDGFSTVGEAVGIELGNGSARGTSSARPKSVLV